MCGHIPAAVIHGLKLGERVSVCEVVLLISLFFFLLFLFLFYLTSISYTLTEIVPLYLSCITAIITILVTNLLQYNSLQFLKISYVRCNNYY